MVILINFVTYSQLLLYHLEINLKYIYYTDYRPTFHVPVFFHFEFES